MLSRRAALLRLSAAAAAPALSLAPAAHARGSTAAELNAAADQTLARLKAAQPAMAELMGKARAMLIFPHIVKGGLLVGAAAGEGVLRVGGKTTGYYLSTAVSYGLQAGVTRFGYVMAMMDDASVEYVRNADGWEIGVGPTITLLDDGFAQRLTSTTYQEGILVAFVGQEGVFAGAGVEGTKITKIEK